MSVACTVLSKVYNIPVHYISITNLDCQEHWYLDSTGDATWQTPACDGNVVNGIYYYTCIETSTLEPKTIIIDAMSSATLIVVKKGTINTSFCSALHVQCNIAPPLMLAGFINRFPEMYSCLYCSQVNCPRVPVTSGARKPYSKRPPAIFDYPIVHVNIQYVYVHVHVQTASPCKHL